MSIENKFSFKMGHKWSKNEEKQAKKLFLTENWPKMRVYSDFLAFLDQNVEKF